jgi:hypothetical protein
MIPILISNSRNTEVDGTTTQIIQDYATTTLNTDVNLELIMNPLKDKSVLLSAAIGRLKEKSVQQTNDEIRDEKIDGVYYLLLSASHNPKEKVQQAAAILLELFEQYGRKMKDESYTRESSMVNSLLNDYATDTALAAIADVPQCADYIAALKTAEDNFEANRLSYEAAIAQEGTQENASKLKKEVLELINSQLVPYLNVMVQLNDTIYGVFTRTVAAIIAANNEVVKKRRKTEEPEEGEV